MISLRKSNEKNFRVEIWILAWFCFFSFFRFFDISNYSAVLKILVVSIIPVIYLVRHPFPLKLYVTLWALFGIIYTFGIFSATDLSSVIAWIFQKWLLIILVIFLSSTYGWLESFPKIFLCMSGIHVFATILEFIIPGVIHSIASFLLPSGTAASTLQLYSYGFHCGIAQQASYDASYIGVAIAILFGSFVVENRENKINNKIGIIILMLLAFVALLLTGKRGMLIAILAAVAVAVIVFLVFKRGVKFRYIALITIGVICIWLIVVNTDVAENVIRRLQYTDNFLTGRESLWATLIEGIEEHPLLGNGSASFSLEATATGHNAFLQVWYENGILGFLVVVVIVLYGIYVAVRGYIKYNNTVYSRYYMMSIVFQIYFVVSCLTDSLFYHNITMACYLVFYSIPFALDVQRKVVLMQNTYSHKEKSMEQLAFRGEGNIPGQEE